MFDYMFFFFFLHFSWSSFYRFERQRKYTFSFVLQRSGRVFHYAKTAKFVRVLQCYTMRAYTTHYRYFKYNLIKNGKLKMCAAVFRKLRITHRKLRLFEITIVLQTLELIN